jgi:hypothetical protein
MLSSMHDAQSRNHHHRGTLPLHPRKVLIHGA